MTDRVFALSVALEKDTRTDDVKSIINAIKMINGVLTVKMNISDISQYSRPLY